MKNLHQITLSIAKGALFAAALLAAAPSEAQLPKDPVERAKIVAQIYEMNASQLTMFDRAGKELNKIGPRGMYDRPVLSPDGKRIAVIKGDIDKETRDVWVVDTTTGASTQITTGQPREAASTPTWSPDSTQVAYVALRAGSYGLFHKSADGTGTETLEYKSSSPIDLVDWSLDGKYLSFFRSDLGGSSLLSLPLDATGEKKPIESVRSPFRLQGPRISPDGKFILYVAIPSGTPQGRLEAFVRPFDPAATAPSDAIKGAWQISEQGAVGMAYWRRDGKELYFLTPNRTVMSVSVTTTPQVEFGKPQKLFSLPETSPIGASQAGMAKDGQRVIIAVPPPQLRQLTLLDRQGKPTGTIGTPGLYGQAAFSPDGTRVAVTKNDSQTGRVDLWTFDLATGKATQITNDAPAENFPVWSPDGKQLAYVSLRGNYFGIYRRAADGTGNEELMFRYTPGAGIALSDWSSDGKFMTFFTGVLLVVPLEPPMANPLNRMPIEWLKEEYEAVFARFSPDTRLMAYMANEDKVDVMQVYVRPFDASKPDKPGPGAAVKVSTNPNGANGALSWRKDGKELLYLTRDFEMMASDITTAPALQAGAPHMLFKLPMPMPVIVSPDGQRFLVPMLVQPTMTR